MTTNTTAPLSARLRHVATAARREILHSDETAITEAADALDERDEEIERLTKRVESLENSRSCAIADHVAAEARVNRAEARATQAEAREAGLREVLERADRSISYPVSTQIRPEGFDVKTDDDTVRFVAEIIRAALLSQPAQGADPLDMPLPCNVNLPGMRFGKGVSLRTLVDAAARWKVIAAKVPLAEMEPALEEARSAALLTTETEGAETAASNQGDRQ